MDNERILKKNFDDNFENKVVHILRKYDSERKDELSRAILWTVIPLVSGSILSIIEYFVYNTSFPIKGLFVAPGIVLLLFGIIYYATTKENFEKDIKNKIMDKLLAGIGYVSYQSTECISDNIINESKLFRPFNESYSDDNFSGTYNKVRISISERVLAYTRRKRRDPVFKGILILLDMNKSTSNITIARNKTLFQYKTDYKMERIILEDIVFNKQYDIFSENQTEARYILTTAFMERLKNIQLAFNSGRISCSFFKNQLLIGVDTSGKWHSNLFDICSLWKPLYDRKQFDTLRDELISIITLIDTLKLDEETGL